MKRLFAVALIFSSHLIIGVPDPGANPPKTATISPNNETYRKITKNFLKGRGLLDRDMEEVFIPGLSRLTLRATARTRSSYPSRARRTT